jgi:pyruvate/2-oxoglutarate dehydrogenase complex dihydrolipoamide dehydrogenase (E3) component
MAVDYDLVIVGSSGEGIYAAKQAVQLQARVALVTQGDELFLPNDSLINQSFNQIGQLNYQLTNSPFPAAIQSPEISLTQATHWARGINSTMQSHNSLANLAALGVDVIADRGEFCLVPQLAFQVGKRKLRSRNFLLATGANFGSNLKEDTNYLTPRELWQRDLAALGKRIIIVGGDPSALELAQTLARFRIQVTLVIEQPRILPQEDLDLALLIQAQLEASGIEIYPNSQISQIKTINGHKWLQAGDYALTADEIIIANRRQPNVAGLNLAKVGVKCDRQRVYVNQKLQTTNPNIYACGDLIGGYSLPNIANYEASIVLKNTLFFSWYKTNYYSLPWAVFTQPNLARVGLTEWQANQKYGDDIYVVKEDFHNVAQAQISDRQTGMCKLLVRENGEIIGCSIIGDRATELIEIVALMIEHKIKLKRNPMAGLTSISIPTIYPSMAEILANVANIFYWQKLQRNPKLLNRLRSWFSIRKDWHK